LEFVDAPFNGAEAFFRPDFFDLDKWLLAVAWNPV
jgi:hypothetical protein